jgi:intermediate peptidase
VAKVIAASSIQDYRHIVKDLDRLSDLLCRVIDLSDFVRSTHPNQEMQVAANRAYGKMFQYMNVLNTTSELNEQLQRAEANPEISASWSEEEKVVAQMLLRDFAKSAINMGDQKKQSFVDLSDEVSQWGTEFVDEMAPAQHYLPLSSHRLRGMDPVVVKQMTKWGTVHLPTVGALATSALRTAQSKDTRKEIYIANRTASQDQIYRLEKMLKARAELAKLSDFASFAHLTLGEKMAKSPRKFVIWRGI